MIKFEIPYEIVEIDFPDKSIEFHQILKISKSKYSLMRIEDVKWEYSWIFDNRNPQDEDEIIDFELNESQKMDMKFPERLDYEFDRIVVKLIMTAGEFQISDEIDHIPEEVMSVASELIKIMMLEEQKYEKNQEIIDSIPPVKIDEPTLSIDTIYDESIDSLDIIEEHYDMDDAMDLTVDNILDKINKYGIDSLNKRELNFLNNQ